MISLPILYLTDKSQKPLRSLFFHREKKAQEILESTRKRQKNVTFFTLAQQRFLSLFLYHLFWADFHIHFPYWIISDVKVHILHFFCSLARFFIHTPKAKAHI